MLASRHINHNTACHRFAGSRRRQAVLKATEFGMTLKNIPLSALCPPNDNPRRIVDDAKIANLAESIKTDGVLQNLIVEPAEGDTFRVVSGMRRFLALKLLEAQGAIDGDYKVPT
jgi:ParB-like chromosome segregation protein Spo0J